MTRGRTTRDRFAVSAGIAALVIALVGIVFVVSTADPADSPVADPDTTTLPDTTPTTVWTPPADDPTRPSPAAVAAGREFRAAPDDLLDCGVHVRTSGWPRLRVMTMLAVDLDGRAAAHTRVHVNPTRPTASYQWDTAVADRHRGRGIGKWIKAAMWRWLREAEPAATRLTTGNAPSNDAMLAINVAMGYEPLVEYGAWQAPTDEMRATLS